MESGFANFAELVSTRPGYAPFRHVLRYGSEAAPSMPHLPVNTVYTQLTEAAHSAAWFCAWKDVFMRAFYNVTDFLICANPA